MVVRSVGIGIQDFEKMIVRNCFYVDKTMFIKEWWENNDDVTLITRPRRFGKTLTMNMTERFFSVKYAKEGRIFENLAIWKEEKYRSIQGTYPVISLSFANVKETDFEGARRKICQLIEELYIDFYFLLDSEKLVAPEKETIRKAAEHMGHEEAALSLNRMSRYLYKYYGKKVIVLLDEYDTPMQEAYVHGYWQEMVDFIRNLFNATFKTNPYLERAIMTGITRVSRESVFSDLNNLEVVTTTTDRYTDSFGFTQEEVTDALKEFELSDQEERVRQWYDGFIFGSRNDIYNPWSILNYLKNGVFAPYWANTSSNSLVGKLIREGDRNVKTAMEDLLNGKILWTAIDEQIVFGQLGSEISAIWSLLLASGYLKVEGLRISEYGEDAEYGLVLTNQEVRMMFEKMIDGWFSGSLTAYNDFVKAMLLGDIESMNDYMNEVAFQSFSYFDTGKNPYKEDPERFYHGFVLGLMVDLWNRYIITSNRESGFGRYDVVLEPRKDEDPAFILEFKVRKPKREKTLEDTVKAALKQIEDKGYEAALLSKGIRKDRIRKYGLAFEGKTVLIGG